jgi:hypothetical protein
MAAPHHGIQNSDIRKYLGTSTVSTTSYQAPEADLNNSAMRRLRAFENLIPRSTEEGNHDPRVSHLQDPEIARLQPSFGVP